MKNTSNIICYTCSALVGAISLTDVANLLSLILTLVCIVTAIVNTIINIKKDKSKTSEELEKLVDEINTLVDKHDKK